VRGNGRASVPKLVTTKGSTTAALDAESAEASAPTGVRGFTAVDPVWVAKLVL